MDSTLTNYSEDFDEWLDAETEECRACYGTGLDKDEIYDCPVCAGEGEVTISVGPPIMS